MPAAEQETSDRPYLGIVAYYEDHLARHGDTHLGIAAPRAEDVPIRHEVMLGVIRKDDAGRRVSLLDLGCGASGLYEHMRERGITNVDYAGLDLSPKFIELSRSKFPGNQYYCVDVLSEDVELPRFDYVVMNGVLTVKVELSFEQMLSYFERMITKAFSLADRGIAFNVMSKQVDWERNDLFHLPLDTLAWFLTKKISRHFVIRNDYALYEYTAYVYRDPVEPRPAPAAADP
jgi:SAM-dependent methyltransferase